MMLGSMLRFLARRLVGIIVVVLVLTAVTFVLFYASPASPAQLSCGKPCTAERLADAEHFMGFDKPVPVQYGEFLVGMVAGRSYGEGQAKVECAAPCLGYSFRLNQPVLSLIGDRFPATVSIAIGAAILWLLIGVSAGVLSAIRRGGWADRAVMIGSIAGVSAPVYLVGLIGILLFGFTLNMVPVDSYVPLTEDPIQWAWHLVLPWFTLAFTHAAIYARLTRGEMLDALTEDFVRTARAKGLSEGAVVRRHGLRAALVPIVTVFGLDLGSLLGGAIITESVFNMQGIGRLLIESVRQSDLPVVVGVVLFSGILIVVVNLLIDLFYAVLDPRTANG